MGSFLPFRDLRMQFMLWKAMVLADLMDEFSPTTRARGSGYHSDGAVRILAHSTDVIRATVKGSKTYGVKIQHAERGVLFLSCTCPFFCDSGACKHLWATALSAAEQGMLAKIPSPARIQLEGGTYREDDEEKPGVPKGDDRFNAGLEQWARLLRNATGARPPSLPRETRRPTERQQPPLWERLLDHARQQTGPETAVARPVARVILYVVDAEGSKSGDLVLLVMERPQRKDGTWGKEKAAHVPIAELPLLADEHDREILPLLQTASRPSSSYYYGYSEDTFPSEVRVPAGMIAMLMPRLSASGRLHMRRGPDEMTPASYDGERVWELALVVERDASRSYTDVVGQLRRGDECVDLAVPLVLARGGWLLFPGRISRFEHFHAFGMVATLRQHQRIRVPCCQEEALLTKLLALPGLPRLVLPAELALQEVALPPQPVLKIGPPDQRSPWRASADRPVAELLFDYQGESIPEGELRAIVPRVAERLLIRRDRAAEHAAVVKLAGLGFRARRPPALLRGGGAPPGFEIVPKKVPGAVRALLADGWRVEADGKLYRRPGRFQLEVTSGIDWFDLTATVDFDGVPAALPALLRALRQGENTVVLGDGSFGILPEEWLAKYGLLGELGSAEGEKLRFRRSQAGILDAALLAAEADTDSRVDEMFARARKELARFEGVTAEDEPAGFRGELRPYQKLGLGWMTFLRRFGFGGCLADDMGLGKTIQVLAMLAARRRDGHPPSLAVVPKSLVWNWQQEAARFVPELRVRAHVGPARASEPAALADADLVITTYGTLRKDVMFLRALDFDYVMLDEAQAIKNADSESAKAARLLRGRHRLALSGTPVENHVGELWSLFEFLNPGMLGTARIFQGVGGGSRPRPEVVALLARALRPFILRRNKEAVAPELPPKHQETILCELEPGQRRLYHELREHYRASLLGRIEKQGLGKVKLQVLEALLRLRQAACHPGLIDRKRAKEPSAKLEVLLPRLLELREEGHKALVFSQFTSFLALVRSALDDASVSYEYLDGKTHDRERRVARFQTDPECGLFLISLKAGGVGLNLTAADYVFILDPWWNPAVEAQAVDRAHRIGQEKRVFVYRLLAKETVEEKVAALQESKRGLAESIITGDNSLLRELDRETLEAMLD